MVLRYILAISQIWDCARGPDTWVHALSNGSRNSCRATLEWGAKRSSGHVGLGVNSYCASLFCTMFTSQGCSVPMQKPTMYSLRPKSFPVQFWRVGTVWDMLRFVYAKTWFSLSLCSRRPAAGHNYALDYIENIMGGRRQAGLDTVSV